MTSCTLVVHTNILEEIAASIFRVSEGSRQQFPPKRWCLSTKLDGITSQNVNNHYHENLLWRFVTYISVESIFARLSRWVWRCSFSIFFSNENIISVFKNIFIKTKIRHLLLAVYVACVVITVKKIVRDVTQQWKEEYL